MRPESAEVVRRSAGGEALLEAIDRRLLRHERW
jgi:hypothetical protein